MGESNVLLPSIFHQGGGIDDGISHEDTPSLIHSFAFPSGIRKEEVKNNSIEENKLLIPLNFYA